MFCKIQHLVSFNMHKMQEKCVIFSAESNKTKKMFFFLLGTQMSL